MIRFDACFFLCILILPHMAWSAPPVLNWVFPAGGTQGTTVQADLGGTFPDWPPTIWSNCKDVTVTPGQKPRCTFKIQPDAEPGPRLFRLTSKGGASALKCFWVGHIPEIEEKEPNDSYLKPQYVGPGPVLVNGRLATSGDSDTFSLNVKKGQSIIAKVQANQGLNSPMDSVLQILSPEGFILAENHDRFSLDPFIQFLAPLDGIYRVRIFTFPATPDTTIRLAGSEAYIYRLTLTTGPYLDHSIPMVFHPGMENTIQLAGWNLTKEMTPLRINPLANFDEVMIYKKDVAGFFRTHSTNLPIMATSPKETKTIIKGEAVVSGCIDSQKKHLFELKLTKGLKYRVKVQARQVGSDLDPVLVLRDEKGKEIKRADDEDGGRDVSMEFSTQSESSLLELFDLHLHSGEMYYYRLDLALVKPDYELILEGDNFTSKNSNPVEIPIKVVRIGGHNQDIVISANGLPRGWSAEKLVIGPKTPSPAKFILKPDSKPEPGFFGMASQSNSIQKRIVHNIPVFETKTDQFFLFPEPQEKK